MYSNGVLDIYHHEHDLKIVNVLNKANKLEQKMILIQSIFIDFY